MSEEVDRLRQQAESLLALAIKAREQGQFATADSLLAEAAQFSNEAEELEAQARDEERAQEIRPARRLEKKD